MKFKIILVSLVTFECFLRAENVSAHTLKMTAECIDNFADFVNHQWDYTTGSTLLYADTSFDLPDELKGKFEETGIFYFVSPGVYTAGQGVWKNVALPINPESEVVNSNNFLYIKYYSHIQRNEERQVVVFKGRDNDHVILPLTSNFTWSEAVVPIEFGVEASFTGTWVWHFETGEVYLIDKFALVLGYPDMNLEVEQIQSLCNFSSQNLLDYSNRSSMIH